jgi:endosialidase-like protein
MRFQKFLVYTSVLAILLALVFLAQIAMSWTGPTAAPPNNNVAAPINVGSVDQTKDGVLGVNGLAVFGTTLLAGADRYLNWGATAGLNGYGLRDNGGTIEYKNNGGNWTSLNTQLGWIISGNDVYNTNSGSLGVGAPPNGNALLEVRGGISVGSAAPFAVDPTYATNNNYIMFGHPGTSEDFIGYNSNTFYFADATGGGDVIHPSVVMLGNAFASAFLYSSDARLKESVTTLKDGFSKVLALRPVSFTWKEEAVNEGGDIGFIAQEVEKIVPEVVHTDAHGLKSVDYPKLVPLLVKAIQEQQADNERQQRDIDALKTDIATLRSTR